MHFAAMTRLPPTAVRQSPLPIVNLPFETANCWYLLWGSHGIVNMEPALLAGTSCPGLHSTVQPCGYNAARCFLIRELLSDRTT